MTIDLSADHLEIVLIALKELVKRRKADGLPNFVEEGAFRRLGEPEARAIRSEWNLPAEALVVGIIARLEPVKDHATLLRAIARLRPRWPSLRLVVVGGGSRAPALEALATSLGTNLCVSIF